MSNKPPQNVTTTTQPWPELYQTASTSSAPPEENIPSELPPRPTQPHRTTRSGFRNCLTLNFLRSYSLRGLGSDRRKRWRRILMILTLLILFLTAVMEIVIMFLVGLWAPGIVVVVVDVAMVWGLGWSLAVIGDSVGTKRACGLTFGRTFFDVFLGVVLFLYCMWIILTWTAIGLFSEAGWVATGLLVFTFGWIASEPPIYPNDVV